MASAVEVPKTGSRSFTRNTTLNLLGQLIPMVIGLISIPLLIRHLGMERFGLLSLIWVAIGYFTFFDLGLGRAVIKLVAERLGDRRTDEIPQIVWNALLLMGAMSLIGSIVLCLITPFLVKSIFNIPVDLQEEAVHAFYGLSLSLLLVTLTAGLRGVMEAYHRFDYANFLQVLMGSSTFLVPLAVSFWTASLFLIVVALILARILIFLAHLAFVWSLFPHLRNPGRIDKKTVRRLFRFATWMTVSNIVSPIMVYFDRFILGAVVPVAQLAYYTTPYEIVNRLLVIPAALVRTLFPTFALMGGEKARDVDLIFERCVKSLLFLLFPAILLILYFGEEGMRLWLGTNFAEESTIVLQILALGILMNGIAYIPFTLIQSADRPDLTAKIHMIELPLYLPVIWLFASRYGTMGAAMAWTLRVSVDMLLMFVAVRRVLPEMSGVLSRLLAPLLVFLVLLAPSFLNLTVVDRALLVFVIIPVFSLIFWSFVLRLQDRLEILKRFRLQVHRSCVHQLPRRQERSANGVWAVVVTYNPDVDVVGNVKSYIDQVDGVVIVDNASGAESQPHLLQINDKRVITIVNPENLGIAAALNLGVRVAHDNSAEWVVTFDQDSKVPPNYVDSLLKLQQQVDCDRSVAVIAPSYMDEKQGFVFRQSRNGKEVWSEIRSAFTSGSIVRLSALEAVGLFEEELFIDYVDHELCLRLLSFGYKVIEARDVYCLHNLGSMKLHWFVYRSFSATHHNPQRRYYMSRNRLYLYRRFFLIEPEWVLNDMWSFAKEFMKILLVEEEKLRKLMSIARGIGHGIRFQRRDGATSSRNGGA